VRPVPTWKLQAPVCQSPQAADMKSPEDLTASIGVGATRGAMVGDQSLRKAWGKVIVSSVRFQAASA
jgi:hypothetical protein